MHESEQEKKNKRTALMTTIGVNAILLFLLTLAAGWRAPNPPLPEYGIELNFGTDETGSGDVQPTEPVGAQENTTESPSEQSESEPDQSEVKELQPEPDVVSNQESPVVVKEEKKPEPKPVEPEKKDPDKPKTPVKKDDPKPDPAAAFKASADKTGKQGGEGDDKGKTGDKGSPEGTPDKNAYFGKAGGGGGGFGLDMSGWDWDQIPQAPTVPDDLGGKVVFEIVVDSEGEILRIDVLESTLSAEAIRLCKQEIQKRSLVRKSGGIIPETSKGKVVFNLTIK